MRRNDDAPPLEMIISHESGNCKRMQKGGWMLKIGRYHKEEKPKGVIIDEDLLSWIALGVSVVGVTINIYLTFFSH